MNMRSNINVCVYRPRQVILATGSPRKHTLPSTCLSPNQCKQLGVMVMAALAMGLGLTQFFHGKIVESQAKVGQLQASNTVIAHENNHLVATGAQVASRAQVVALARKKLKLFEPDQGQVRRM